jgi:HNH endonuclease
MARLRTPRRRRCSFSGCEEKHYAHGWCAKHYRRWQRHGDPAVVKLVIVQGTPEERFWAKVNKDGPVPVRWPELGPCWVWTGAKSSPLPYGVLSVDGRQVYAHQFALRLAGIPIPEGLEPDHLCEVHGCVRWTHLEVVTHAENMRRLYARS